MIRALDTLDLDTLKVRPVIAAGLHPCLLQLIRDVGRSQPQAFRISRPAFEVVR